MYYPCSNIIKCQQKVKSFILYYIYNILGNSILVVEKMKNEEDISQFTKNKKKAVSEKVSSSKSKSEMINWAKSQLK